MDNDFMSLELFEGPKKKESEWKEKSLIDKTYNLSDFENMNLYKSNFLLQTKKNCNLFDLYILSIFMSRIKQTDTKETEYNIKISEIAQTIRDIKNKDYEKTKDYNTRIRKAIEHIDQATNEYNKILLPNNKYEYILCHWFSYVKISDDLDYIKFKWNEIVAEHLFNLTSKGNYGIQNIKELLLLSKVSSYRLYEIIEANFNSNNKQQELPLKFNEFRDLMGYKNWRPATIKQEIEKAKKEINNFSKYYIEQIIYKNNDTKKNIIEKIILFVRQKTIIEKKFGIGTISDMPELKINKKGRPKGSKNKKNKSTQ